MSEIGDATAWAETGFRSAISTLATRVDKLERLPKVEQMTVETVLLQPDDVLIVRPRTQHLTPGQARELQEHLRERMPDRDIVVIPIPAEITVTRNALP